MPNQWIHQYQDLKKPQIGYRSQKLSTISKVVDDDIDDMEIDTQRSK